jgi:HEAT repeat protein
VPGEVRAVVHFEEEALPILGALAFEMHLHYPEGAAPKEWVIATLATTLTTQRGLAAEQAKGAARAFLQKAGDEAGLLCERGAGAWGFLHLTFQEYFVVAGLHAREEFETQALQNIFEPRWEEILRLGVSYLALVQGRLKAATNFVQQVAQARAPAHVEWITEILHRQMALAALLGAEVAEAMDVASKDKIFIPFADWVLAMPQEISARYLREIGATAGEVLAPFVERLLSHAESEKRQKAAWAAGVLRDPSLARPLVQLLDDPSAEVRATAARSLGALASATAFDRLVQGLKGDPEGEVRAACAEALGLLGDPRAVPELAIAWDDSDQSAVDTSVVALMNLQPLEELRRFSERRSEFSPRVLAAFLRQWPMWMTGPETEMLLANQDPGVRKMAVRAIGARLTRFRNLPNDEFLSLLRRALTDEDRIVRFWAVVTLDDQNTAETVPLLKAATQDPDDFVAAAAAEELSKTDPKAAWDALQGRITSGASG